MVDCKKEKALKYLNKRLWRAGIAMQRAINKSGAEQEIDGLLNKIEVLEWLKQMVLRECGNEIT